MFIDEAKIYVKSGDGGNGCTSLHREIYMPKGGPDGGNGGRGGNVIIEGSRDLNTLLDFKKHVHIKAKRGMHGQGNNKAGKDAEDTIVRVPLGTVIYNSETGKFLGDIVRVGQQLVVARGGRGGRGNAAFATAFYRVPRFCEKGEKGYELWLRLELKSLAHVGLVGLPNAGKSTLLAAVTAAKPKIADYPFTTLSPNLGTVQRKPGLQYIFADIPGLIEGASEGAGLGHKFLKHIFRTKMLVHVMDLTDVDPESPLKNFKVIMKELENYDSELAKRPMIVAANKIDVVGTEEAWFSLEKALKEAGIKVFAISAAAGEGTKELIEEIFNMLDTLGDAFISEKPHEQEFITIDESTENLQQFTIEPVEDYFVVHGKGPERMVQMLDLENDEAVIYLQQRLKRMGIEDELKKMGAKAGDFVVIGDFEFNYYPEREIS